MGGRLRGPYGNDLFAIPARNAAIGRGLCGRHFAGPAGTTNPLILSRRRLGKGPLRTLLGADSAGRVGMTILLIFTAETPLVGDSSDSIAMTNLLVFIAMTPLEGASSDSIGSGLCGPRWNDYPVNFYRDNAIGRGLFRLHCRDFIAMTNSP